MSISEQQKFGLLLTLFIGGVVFILIVYFHFMIGRGIINSYERKVASMNGEMPTLRQKLRQIDEMLSQKGEIEKQAEAIRKVTRRLPSSADAPGFLDALVNSLATTGIIQQEVKTEATTDRSLYTEIPYKIKAQGHFHAFGQFLTLIEQSPDRFMRVKNMKVSNNLARPSIHPIEMDITTFMFTSSPREGANDQNAGQ